MGVFIKSKSAGADREEGAWGWMIPYIPAMPRVSWREGGGGATDALLSLIMFLQTKTVYVK